VPIAKPSEANDVLHRLERPVCNATLLPVSESIPYIIGTLAIEPYVKNSRHQRRALSLLSICWICLYPAVVDLSFGQVGMSTINLPIGASVVDLNNENLF